MDTLQARFEKLEPRIAAANAHLAKYKRYWSHVLRHDANNDAAGLMMADFLRSHFSGKFLHGDFEEEVPSHIEGLEKVLNKLETKNRVHEGPAQFRRVNMDSFLDDLKSEVLLGYKDDPIRVVFHSSLQRQSAMLDPERVKDCAKILIDKLLKTYSSIPAFGKKAPDLTLDVHHTGQHLVFQLHAPGLKLKRSARPGRRVSLGFRNVDRMIRLHRGWAIRRAEPRKGVVLGFRIPVR